MFKQIPGNATLQIALSKKIRTIQGWECAPKLLDGGFVEVEMYGKLRCVSLEWLSLIAHFEVHLPDNKVHRLWDINFTDFKINKSDYKYVNKVMVFNKPITYKPGYRIIPNFTRYAINESGTKIINVHTDKELSLNFEDKGYVYANLYDSKRSKYRYVPVHRLVAFAWVHNDDYSVKTLVNHKDGNKHNPRASNLEWCDYQTNIVHAVNNDLRNDNIACKVRNAETGEIVEFKSGRQACEYMGIDVTNKIFAKQHKLRHKLVNGKYEVKYMNDSTPWFYEHHQLGTRSGRFNLHVRFDDGTEKDYPDLLSFKRTFGVWNTSNVEELVSKAESMYPNMKIIVEDHFTVEKVQAYRIETGEVLEFETVRGMCSTLGLSRTKIRNILRKGQSTNYNGYVVRYKSDEPWDLNFIDIPFKSRRILAYKGDSDEQMEFSSLREAARYFDTSRQTIQRVIKSNVHFKSWLLKESVSD